MPARNRGVLDRRHDADDAILDADLDAEAPGCLRRDLQVPERSASRKSECGSSRAFPLMASA
jgi:hypothetical protein